jgi:hypothetical protein
VDVPARLTCDISDSAVWEFKGLASSMTTVFLVNRKRASDHGRFQGASPITHRCKSFHAEEEIACETSGIQVGDASRNQVIEEAE